MLGHTLTHTHTQRQRVSSRLAGGLRVDTAWNIPKQPLPKLQPGKKKTKKKHNLKLFKLSVCVCVSAGPVWHSMWMTIWHHGPVIKEALDLPTSCHHGRRWVVTPQEAGGGLARRLLLRIAATCLSHLLFTYSPSPSVALFYSSQLV